MAIVQSILGRSDTTHRNKTIHPLPLRPLDLPHVLHANSLTFPTQGWTPLSLPPPSIAPIEATSRSLFCASEAFFALPQETKEKLRTNLGSEEGWSCIPGEKELLALRRFGPTPLELQDVASTFWAEVGKLLNEILGRIAESLGLRPDALQVFVGPCAELASERTATMLRLFRYEASGIDKLKVVSESHSDLGLLSLVIGQTPGLEVWDSPSDRWLSLEKTYEAPSATLLVGRQLERLSNGRYRSGKHRVVSYPSSSIPVKDSGMPSQYRYSIVFVLRAHWPVIIDTNTLETPITGPFTHPIQGVTGKDLFTMIGEKHFNVNTGIQEREEQKRRLKEKVEENAQSAKVKKSFLQEMMDWVKGGLM